MKTLVVIYSRTGNTLSVAKRIANELDADLEVIEDKTKRKGILGFLRSGYESVRKKVPAIVEPKHNPKDFDLVIIGTPIWAGGMSSPVRAYLLRFRGQFRHVAFFATSAGGGHDKALGEMAELAAAKPLAKVDISLNQLRSGNRVEPLKIFIEAIRSQKL